MLLRWLMEVSGREFPVNAFKVGNCYRRYSSFLFVTYLLYF